MDIPHEALTVVCGALVGLTLGLIGGGGSILATPLLLYVVGLAPHVAIGTGALSVSANALFNFAGHARCGNVRWTSALIFAVVGALGAIGGSTLGKHFDGQRLLLLFAILMIVVGVLMLRPKIEVGNFRVIRSRALFRRPRSKSLHHGAYCRGACRFFSDRWWISHRAGTSFLDSDADDLCRWVVPARCFKLRYRDRGELCGLGPCRLGCRRALHCWRRRGRPRGNETGNSAGPAPPCFHPPLRHDHIRRGRLYDCPNGHGAIRQLSAGRARFLYE